jgi:lysophospholipase L1-like esterase
MVRFRHVSSVRHGLALLLAMVFLSPARPCHADTPAPSDLPLKGGNARVILVGDSITGLSRNYATGFAHQMDWALQATYPNCRPNLVALGGSGQTINSWLSVEQRSRSEERFLDVPGVKVKESLDQPADVVVIMLGMNDVLAPAVSDTPESLDQWEGNYRRLIAALKERLHAKVVALATATMNTEDPDSPKNRLMAQLNRRVAKLAQELGCRLLPTNATAWDVLRQGRRLRPDFHVTYDFVHPNEAGHLAIAIAMLRGLGEEVAAKRLADQRLAAVLRKAAGDGPTLSCAVTPMPGPLNADRQSFRVRYWWTAKPNQPLRPIHVTLTAPDWEVTPALADGAEGEFTVTGVPARRENLLALQGSDGQDTVKREVKICAPWLVTAGLVQPFWSNMKFNPAKSRTPVDDAIQAGGSFSVDLNLGKGQKLAWQRYFPSVNFTGLDAPGNVDFSAVTHAQNFEAGYGARWIQSSRPRPVRVDLGVQAFAGPLYLTVFLNGQELYQGHLTAELRKRKTVDANLRQGWNVLVFKANHCTWQWQCTVDLAPLGEDSLDDLRYSIVPQTTAK